MKLIVRLSLMLVLGTGLMTSCKKAASKQVKHIPKAASFVATINTKSLQGKLMQNQASLENILKSFGNDTAASKGKQEWEDLKESGLDLSENFYIAVVQKNAGMSMGGANRGTMVMSALGTLKDEKKLQAYIKKKQPNAEIRKEKNYSYTTVEGDKMVAWGDDMVIMMNYDKSFDRKMEFDSATGSFNFQEPVNAGPDMKKEMDSYFTMKEDQSVAAIPEFRDLLADKSDASMWVNSSNSLDAVPLPRMKELFGSAFTAATLNFEDGKIDVMSKSYYSKELREILEKYSDASADVSLIEKYPSENVNGFFAFAINPEFINAIVRKLEMGGMVDAWLAKNMGASYKLQDLLKAMKGDFAVIVSDVKVDGANAGTPAGKPTFNVIGNIAVGDKEQMNKLMDKLVEMGMMVKTPAGYNVNAQMQKSGVVVSVDEKNLLVSMNQTLVADYKAGNKKAKLDNAIMSDFKGKQGFGYVNIESLLNGVTLPADTSASRLMAKAKETFKDAKMSVDKYDGKTMEAHYELRFKNEKENSLASILKLAEAASSTMQQHKMNRVNMDSIPVTMR